MRPRHLEVFHAVMVTGSVSGAARLLNVSQPAVTKMLFHAEHLIGLRLFDRSGGKILPTAEAQALFAETTKVMGALEDVRRLARNLRDTKSGRIRVASTHALSMDILPLAVRSFLRAYPQVFCEIDTSHTRDIIRAVLTHEVDVGFAFEAPPHEAVRAEAVARGRMIGLVPPRLVSDQPCGPIALSAFAAWPFVALDADDPLGSLIANRCRALDLTLRALAKVHTYRLAATLAEAGAGATIVDQYTALGVAGRIEMRELDPPIHFAVHALTARSRQPTPFTEHFIRLFKAAERRASRPLVAPGLGSVQK